jgi:hypothetical protein
MAENSVTLRPCPFCGAPGPEIVLGEVVCCHAPDCYGYNSYDKWQQPRTPPPATKALLEQAKMIVSGNVGATWRKILQDFIDEWK